MWVTLQREGQAEVLRQVVAGVWQVPVQHVRDAINLYDVEGLDAATQHWK